jgi:hypothetical protein
MAAGVSLQHRRLRRERLGRHVADPGPKCKVFSPDQVKGSVVGLDNYGFAAASQGLAHGFWRAGSGVGAGEGGKPPVGSFLIDPGA